MKKLRLSLAAVLLSGLLCLSTAFAGPRGPNVYGEITDVIAAAGYTYVQIDTGNGKVWAAGPETKLKVGDRTGFSTDMPMANFHSKAMDRDFKVIYFVNQFLSDGDTAEDVEVKDLSGDSAPMNGGMDGNMGNMGSMPGMSGNMGSMSGMAGSMAANGNSPHSTGAMHGQGGQAMKPKLKDFDKVDGGYTIAEVYAQKKTLGGKTIRVRGQVAKYTANVMGKNWLHIVDSSGDKDLTVVTSDTSGLGDVVVIEGKLELDQDFDFGYFYPVIVKDARVTIE